MTDANVIPLRRQPYFGQWWDAPAYDDATKVETPVGTPCLMCGEEIAEGDSGNYFVGSLEGLPQHLECWLRSSLGSLEHLQGRCTCVAGGREQGSYREQARAVMAWVLERRRLGLPVVRR